MTFFCFNIGRYTVHIFFRQNEYSTVSSKHKNQNYVNIYEDFLLFEYDFTVPQLPISIDGLFPELITTKVKNKQMKYFVVRLLQGQ